MTDRERNLEAFRVWRAAVIRLAKWDRYKNELEAAKQRIIRRAIDSVGPCDCPPCIARILEHDKRVNWPRLESV